MMEVIFWVFGFFLFWHYIGYGLLISILARKKSFSINLNEIKEWPTISIIIPAYNEEKVIARRIRNCLALDYPKEKMEIIIGSDGSFDKTFEESLKFKDFGVKVFNFPINRGRSQVHNDCVSNAFGEIIFFTDANTLYESDCIKNMVRYYSHPKIGCVGGEVKSSSFTQDALGRGQRLYWNWEYKLRRCMSKLGILTKTSGANMSMRKELYHRLQDTIDIDQAAAPMVLMSGYYVIHEPDAIAYDDFSTSLKGELLTRRRLSIRALTALWYYRKLINPFRYPWISFNLISYRLLRYFIPFILIIIFTCNLLLIKENFIYLICFVFQLFYYLCAIIGFILYKKNKNIAPFSLQFILLWSYIGMAIGVIEFFLGRRIRSYKSTN